MKLPYLVCMAIIKTTSRPLKWLRTHLEPKPPHHPELTTENVLSTRTGNMVKVAKLLKHTKPSHEHNKS